MALKFICSYSHWPPKKTPFDYRVCQKQYYRTPQAPSKEVLQLPIGALGISVQVQLPWNAHAVKMPTLATGKAAWGDRDTQLDSPSPSHLGEVPDMCWRKPSRASGAVEPSNDSSLNSHIWLWPHESPQARTAPLRLASQSGPSKKHCFKSLSFGVVHCALIDNQNITKTALFTQRLVQRPSYSEVCC